MQRLERHLVIAAIVNMAVYITYLVSICLLVENSVFDDHLHIIFPWHFAGMFLNFTALVLTIRDLYKRPFPKENDKLTWGILILHTGGIGWLIYIFKHAFKPRGGIDVLEDS